CGIRVRHVPGVQRCALPSEAVGNLRDAPYEWEAMEAALQKAVGLDAAAEERLSDNLKENETRRAGLLTAIQSGREVNARLAELKIGRASCRDREPSAQRGRR